MRHQEYEKLVQLIIEKQIEVLGGERVKKLAIGIYGLRLADDGTLAEISGEPAKVLEDIVEHFKTSFPLSKSLLRMQLLMARTKFPNISIPEIH